MTFLKAMKPFWAFVVFALSTTVFSAVHPLRNPADLGPVRATYVDFYRNLTQMDIERELDEMRSIGIDTVFIVSVGQLNDTGRLGSAIYPSQYVDGPAPQDKLGWILAKASQLGMYVHVGSLQTRLDWYGGAEFSTLRQRNKDVMREVLQRYSQYPALTGVYFTQEIWMNWVKSYGSTYYGITISRDFVVDMRSLNPNWVLSFAPVYKKTGTGAMPGLDETEYYNTLTTFLQSTNFDLVMPQDGFGAGAGAPALSDPGVYHFASYMAAYNLGKTCWFTIEVFEDDPAVAPGPARQRHSFRPASFSRVSQQLAITGQCLGGCVMWLYGDHLSSTATYEPGRATKLRMDYANAYGISTEKLLPISSYTYSTPPSASYPDPGNTKLKNGIGGGYNGVLAGSPPPADVAWNTLHASGSFVGWADTYPFTIDIDLGQYQQVKRVELLARGEQLSGILFPSVTQVSYDSGGGVFVPLGPDSLISTTTTPGAFNMRLVSVGGIIPVSTNRLKVTINSFSWVFLAEIRVIGN